MQTSEGGFSSNVPVTGRKVAQTITGKRNLWLSRNGKTCGGLITHFSEEQNQQSVDQTSYQEKYVVSQVQSSRMWEGLSNYWNPLIIIFFSSFMMGQMIQQKRACKKKYISRDYEELGKKANDFKWCFHPYFQWMVNIQWGNRGFQRYSDGSKDGSIKKQKQKTPTWWALDMRQALPHKDRGKCVWKTAWVIQRFQLKLEVERS